MTKPGADTGDHGAMSPNATHTTAREAGARLAVRTDAEALAEAFPALLLEAERLAHTVAAGVHGRRRAGVGETFWQHRPYAFGDPVGAIDWRQSARAANRLYVRQNEWEAAAAVWVWRDPSRSLDYASSSGLPTKRRRADVLATALAILLAEGGERIGVIGQWSGGARARPFHGRAAPSLFLEALDVAAFDDAAGADSAPPPDIAAGAGSCALFISDFFLPTAALDNAVARLAARGVRGVLFQVVDPAEEVFPFAGRTVFEDAESRDQLTFGDAAAVREDYARRFAALRAELATLAGRSGWRFLAHRTDAPATTALMAAYGVLSDARGLPAASGA